MAEPRNFHVWVVLNVAAQADYLVAELVARGHDVGSMSMKAQAMEGMGMSATFAYKVTAWWSHMPGKPCDHFLNEIKAILQLRKAGYHTVLVVDFETKGASWTGDFFVPEPRNAHEHITEE